MKKLWISRLLISTVWLFFFNFYVRVIDNNCDVLIVSVMIMSAVRGTKKKIYTVTFSGLRSCSNHVGTVTQAN